MLGSPLLKLTGPFGSNHQMCHGKTATSCCWRRQDTASINIFPSRRAVAVTGAVQTLHFEGYYFFCSPFDHKWPARLAFYVCPPASACDWLTLPAWDEIKVILKDCLKGYRKPPVVWLSNLNELTPTPPRYWHTGINNKLQCNEHVTMMVCCSFKQCEKHKVPSGGGGFLMWDRTDSHSPHTEIWVHTTPGHLQMHDQIPSSQSHFALKLIWMALCLVHRGGG